MYFPRVGTVCLQQREIYLPEHWVSLNVHSFQFMSATYGAGVPAALSHFVRIASTLLLSHWFGPPGPAIGVAWYLMGEAALPSQLVRVRRPTMDFSGLNADVSVTANEGLMDVNTQ